MEKFQPDDCSPCYVPPWGCFGVADGQRRVLGMKVWPGGVWGAPGKPDREPGHTAVGTWRTLFYPINRVLGRVS